jgi:hypothetical protein
VQPILPAYFLSFFLLIVVFIQIRYLWKVRKDENGLIYINYSSFFIFILASGGVSLLYIGLIGPAHAVMALALGMGTVVAFLHPVIACSFFISCTLIRPWEQGIPSPLWSFLPKMLAGICIISLLLNWVKTREVYFFWNKGCFIYILMLFWFVISCVFTGQAIEGTNFLFTSFFPVTIILLLVYNVVKTKADLYLLTSTVVTSAVGVVVSSIVYTYVKNEGRLVFAGMYANSNDLAALIVIALPYLVGPYLVRENVLRDRPRKFYAYSGGALLMYALYATQSRAAMIAVAVAGLVYLLSTFKLGFKAMAGIGTFLIVAYILSGLIERNEEDLALSQESRKVFLIAGLRITRSMPLFGCGVDRYKTTWMNYVSDSPETGERTAHNSFILAMAETGIPGFLLYTSLFIYVLSVAWRLRKIYPEYLLSGIAYGIKMCFLSHTHLFLPYLTYVIILSGGRVLKNTIPETTS